MPAKYAATTQVGVDRSVAEIRRTLDRYGSTAFAYAEEQGRAAVQFDLKGRRIRLVLPIPALTDKDIAYTPSGQKRSATSAKTFHETAVKQRWRALSLVVKAKLEAVEAGVAEFEVEFAPYTVMSDGRTAAEHIGPWIDHDYEHGTIPPLLPPTTYRQIGN